MPDAMHSPTPTRRQALRALMPLLLAGGLSACGFRLRGAQPLPFATLHLGVDTNSEFGQALARKVGTSGTTVAVTDPAQADARLEILGNQRSREILSLSAAGKVREYQLFQTLSFRVVDRNGEELLAPVTLHSRREYNFDDTRVIAKEREEALLFRDMEAELLQQMMDRLATLSP